MANETWASAGRLLQLIKGPFDVTAQYHLLDIVYYLGSTYIAKGYTVGNLPTDTTYFQILAQGTSDVVSGVYFGTCDTQADNPAKAVTVEAADNFVLKRGCIVGVAFTYTNTYVATLSTAITLNVNSTGVRNISFGGSSTPTGVNTVAFGEANYTHYYMYDGYYWVYLSRSGLNTQTAGQTPFDNSTNGFVATDAQAAIEEVNTNASTYSDAIRQAIASRETTTTATTAHAVGSYFFDANLNLCRTTVAIAVGDTITLNTNCVATTVGGEFKKITDANNIHMNIVSDAGDEYAEPNKFNVCQWGNDTTNTPYKYGQVIQGNGIIITYKISSVYIIQLCMVVGNAYLFTRACNNGTWTGWNQVQNSYEGTLNTTDKTIAGAINEVKTTADTANSKVSNAVVLSSTDRIQTNSTYSGGAKKMLSAGRAGSPEFIYVQAANTSDDEQTYNDMLMLCYNGSSFYADLKKGNSSGTCQLLGADLHQEPISDVNNGSAFRNEAFSFYNWNSSTLNTPYKAGLTAWGNGFLITYKFTSGQTQDIFVTQIAVAVGDARQFMRRWDGSTWSSWGTLMMGSVSGSTLNITL